MTASSFNEDSRTCLTSSRENRPKQKKLNERNSYHVRCKFCAVKTITRRPQTPFFHLPNQQHRTHSFISSTVKGATTKMDESTRESTLQVGGPPPSETKKGHYLDCENKNKIPKVLNLLHLIGALLQSAECIFLFAFSRNIHLRWLLFTSYPVPVEDSYAAALGGVGADNLYYAR